MYQLPQSRKNRSETLLPPLEGCHSSGPVLLSVHLLRAGIALGTEGAVWSRMPRALLSGSFPEREQTDEEQEHRSGQTGSV